MPQYILRTRVVYFEDYIIEGDTPESALAAYLKTGNAELTHSEPVHSEPILNLGVFDIGSDEELISL